MKAKEAITNTAVPPRPPLTRLDNIHLDAALGWAELGDYDQSNEELGKLAPRLLAHPNALTLRWHICIRAKNWAAALKIAETLRKTFPHLPEAWIMAATAQHQLNRIEDARETLKEADSKFPHNVIPFRFACNLCALGQIRDAEIWLEKALATPFAPILKLIALQNPALKPLWKKIAGPTRSPAHPHPGGRPHIRKSS